jgi:hypothetical protein
VQSTRSVSERVPLANHHSSVHVLGNITHSNLHYGNAIVYLRMLGLKPPSS